MSRSVVPIETPKSSLLDRYNRAGGYTDCYMTSLEVSISHSEFIEAFYTSWLFKIERFILKWLVNKPSSDIDANQLATGNLDKFAAWTVEDRAENQLLLCDYQSKTRSFLMVKPLTDSLTELYFGSAVVATKASEKGDPTSSFFFRSLSGFHKLYSVALLSVAKKRLLNTKTESIKSGP
ncbi:hypothetical protein [Aliikangiella sp. G2MR2-5]|uniref:hypothetical protein n=1 Tax=Aliikangiella sp. G2MR2-5 TaxID=2788943 RepID=UPI0018AA55A0|nr:hypothetical protein [Aliikangiella sp. G2MR2-5]